MMQIPKILTASLYLLATAGLSHGKTITTYRFPTTDYPEPGSEHPNDGGMVHGLCVLGATDATATLSPDASVYTYNSIPGLKDGVLAFGGSQFPFHGIDGHGTQVCEGGIYLQPSTHYGPPPGVDVTVEATPIDENAGVIICAFIEREFEWGGHHYNRQGNWKQPLIDQGFVASDVQFTFHQPHNDRFTSYCKSFGTSAPSLLSLPSEPSKATPRNDITSFTFPTTAYPEPGSEHPNDGGMVHGLCVLGATDATATLSPDASVYTYNSIPGLKDGVLAFGGSQFPFHGIDGHGTQVCEGGIYLQPSTHYGPPPGVDVTVEATPIDENAGVIICAFIEREFEWGGHHYNRQGNWKQPLIDQGFVASDVQFTFHQPHNDRFTSYCKSFGTSAPSLLSLPSEPSKATPRNDITSFTFPTTAYPEPGSEHPNDGGMVHGLCVLGATDATATLSPDASVYTYNSIPGLKDGVLAFGGSQFPFHGIDGHGTQVCEGGIYLQPSTHYGPPPGVDVTVEATPIDENAGVIICAFIEREFEWGGHHYNRQGNWKQPLIDQGFVASDVQFTFHQPHNDRFTSYCKSFGTSAPSLLSLPSEPSKATPRNDITSFTFPTTAYPEPGSEHPNDGGMVHGLCVLGATDATATLSPDASVYTYNSIPGLKDGVLAFGGSQFPFHGIDGHGTQVCEGGIYLQPSTHYGPPPGVDVTVEATPIDENAGVIICAFIEREFEWGGHHYNRQGNWKQPLIDQGFVASDVQFTFHQPHNDRFTSYCKSFGTSAPSLLSLPSEPSKATPRNDITSFTFPTTAYPEPGSEHPNDGGMVHGLCVLGATDATATLSPDASVYTYNSIPGLKDGVLAFGGSQFPFHGIDGHGTQVCEGGIYLQPSTHYGPPPGVDVTVEATPIDENAGVTICAFIEREFEWGGHHYNRQGNWKQPLIDQGFVASDVQFTFHQPHNDRFTSYCKSFGTPTPTSSPTVVGTSTDLSIISCPEDVKLIQSFSTTEFPSQLSPIPPVSVVSQDSSTVTVALNQVWDEPIDRYFFEYNESVFSSKCYEEVGVNPGEVIETITIQCLTMSSSAFLKICLQDEGGNLLSSEDDATVPKCCHSQAPQGTPTACYNLSVNCVTTCGSESSFDRSLRGRI